MKKLLCLCLSLLLAVSLVACDKQAEEQDSTPPTESVQPTSTPEPEPTPTPPPIPYTDVPEDSYYYDAVVWAYENGIASDSETFEPLSACTRGQAVTFLWRAMGSPEPWIMENPFSDASPDTCFQYETLIHGAGPENDFYMVENGAFVVSDQTSKVWEDCRVNDHWVSEAEYTAAMGKYTNQKKLFWYDSDRCTPYLAGPDGLFRFGWILTGSVPSVGWMALIRLAA